MKPGVSTIEPRLGLVVLFGSGETSPSGRKVFNGVLNEIPDEPRLALLETPAGFEPNSSQVIGRVAEFIRHRLQNHNPRLNIVPARKRGTEFSPDNPRIVAPLLEADMIFMGPGSPTYAVHQLRDSLAWYYSLARHRLGAALVLASAATIAVSAYALPVYEIYKVGEDLHWKKGLDFFGLYGLPLVFIPHWNNNDGGEELDTSRCFMGQKRFAALMGLLPPDLTVLGIDEKTALVMDLEAGSCRVVGLGGVTLIHNEKKHHSQDAYLSDVGLADIARQRQGHVHQFRSGEIFPLSRFNPYVAPCGGEGLPLEIWDRVLEVQTRLESLHKAESDEPAPPQEALDLMEARQSAREQKDWKTADSLRDQIAVLGWQILDTPEGPRLMKIE